MTISVAAYNYASHQQSEFDSHQIRIGTSPACEVIPSGDSGIAEVHCLLVIEQDRKIKITNYDRSIVLNHGARIHRGSSVVIELPASFSIGDTRFQINDLEVKSDYDHALCSLIPSGSATPTSTSMKCVDEVAPGSATLTAWLETVGDLQESAAGSQAFFKDAARTIYNPGGMDGCMILQPQEGKPTGAQCEWKISASHIPYPNCNLAFRPDLVQQAATQRATIFHDASKLTATSNANDLHTAIVCPVLGSQGNIIAIVYGFRTQHSTNNRIGARALEVQFVQLIAKSISSAMKRLAQEAEASRSRVLLEQAFAPKVVQQLEVNPKILDGVSRDVTVMFADLRDFSTISEKVGPKVTYQMLTDVMDCFSEIITRHGGVIIDFYGDGVSAFWNAPLDQPDHTLMAVRAANELLASLPELNSTWGQRLSHRLRAGVGIHCGNAQVGNAGSSTRLKYGPQGATVNITSRLETATKGVGIPMMVSEEVAQRVSSNYYARRICQANLKGMKQPVHVFELFEKPLSSTTIDLLSKYDEGLILFEQQKFSEAIAILCELSVDMPDPATEYLLRQAMAKTNHAIDRRQPDSVDAEILALTSNPAHEMPHAARP